MTTAAPPPSTDSTSPSSRRRSRARPTSRPSSRCAKPTPGPALVIIEPMPDTPPGQGWARLRKGLRDRARQTLRVASTCWSKRSPSRNRERPGIPALPADLKFPVVNRPHGLPPIRSSRHDAKPPPVQARCSPCEDGVEKVEGFDGLPRAHCADSGRSGKVRRPVWRQIGRKPFGSAEGNRQQRQIPEGSTRSDAESADDVIVPGDLEGHQERPAAGSRPAASHEGMIMMVMGADRPGLIKIKATIAADEVRRRPGGLPPVRIHGAQP